MCSLYLARKLERVAACMPYRPGEEYVRDRQQEHIALQTQRGRTFQPVHDRPQRSLAVAAAVLGRVHTVLARHLCT